MSREEQFVDLHIHSKYSDGTDSIEDICQKAVENNVKIIAVTDHNGLAGTRKALEIAAKYGLEAIQGVEIDSTYEGRRCHILGYGFNVNNEEFCSFVNANRIALEATDETTLQRISEDYSIDLAAYKDFEYDLQLGGWKLVHFLVSQGVASDSEVAIRLMKQYKKRVVFPETKEIIEQIHNAGGVAILAHPGETFKVAGSGDAEVDRKINEIYQYGIDGIECFYPKHKASFEKRLIDFCMERDLCITVGSDYHGDFFKGSKQKIGCEFKRLKELRLKGLLD